MKVTTQISVKVFIDVALAHFRIDLFVWNEHFPKQNRIVDMIGMAAEKGAAENVTALHCFPF